VSRPKVLLADDHKAMVQSLVRFLDQEVEIVGIVSDGQALVDAVRQLQPDLVVADISMPVKSGWEAFNELRMNGLAVPFIFLTAHRDADLAAELVGARAAGIVLKYAAGNELVAAIREVLQGGVFVSALISGRQDMGRVRLDRGRSGSK
jgi:DNA-binding NarL/FixJ family response regulator